MQFIFNTPVETMTSYQWTKLPNHILELSRKQLINSMNYDSDLWDTFYVKLKKDKRQ